MIGNLSTQINLLLTVCLMSGLVGTGIMVLGWPQTEAIQTLIYSHPFVVWVTLVCILFVLLPIAFLDGVLELKRLYAATFPKVSVNILWFFLIAVGLFCLPLAVIRQSPRLFPEYIATLESRMDAVVISCILAILPSLLGLSVLVHTVHELSPDRTNFTSRYFDARKSLNGFVLAVGSIIGIGTLATGGCQQTLQAHADAGFISFAFPPELTVLFGAYHSFVLLMLSFPVEVLLHEKGTQFVEQSVPVPPVNSSGWAESCSLRQQVRDFFGLKSNILSQIRVSFGKLTPLIGGLLAYLLPIAS